MTSALEPTQPGWYQYDGGRNTLMFLLEPSGQWHAVSDNGTATRCDWGYIEQALGVFGLKQIASLGQQPSIESPDEVSHNVFEAEDSQYGPVVNPRDMIRRRR